MDKDMEILTFTVKTKKSENDVSLAEDLKISDDINQDFCEQPAKFAWWSVVAAQAQALVDKKKLEIDKQEDYLKKTLIGELDTEIRQELEMNGEKVTETKVTNGIYCHERYVEHLNILYELQEEYQELKEKAIILGIAKDAMVQRKDMLISLGAQLRTEGVGTSELIVKTQQANEIIKANRGKKK